MLQKNGLSCLAFFALVFYVCSLVLIQADSLAQPLNSLPKKDLLNKYGKEISEAMQAGIILKGMTMEQVVLARGAPYNKESIPPDAELWHYASGEVSFDNGRVTYVSLEPLEVAKNEEHEEVKSDTEKAMRSITSIDSSYPEVNVQTASPEFSSSSLVATANSPGDGFLALRSNPSISNGQLLAKIPHKSQLIIEECIYVSKDSQWCKTSYQAINGWVGLDHRSVQLGTRASRPPRGPEARVPRHDRDGPNDDRRRWVSANYLDGLIDASKKSNEGWILQVGSFTKRDKANEIARNLRNTGFPVFIEPAEVDGVRYHRVCVGPRTERKDIEELSLAVRESTGLTGNVRRY